MVTTSIFFASFSQEIYEHHFFDLLHRRARLRYEAPARYRIPIIMVVVESAETFPCIFTLSKLDAAPRAAFCRYRRTCEIYDENIHPKALSDHKSRISGTS
jgi:hypothetical protein